MGGGGRAICGLAPRGRQQQRQRGATMRGGSHLVVAIVVEVLDEAEDEAEDDEDEAWQEGHEHVVHVLEPRVFGEARRTPRLRLQRLRWPHPRAARRAVGRGLPLVLVLDQLGDRIAIGPVAAADRHHLAHFARRRRRHGVVARRGGRRGGHRAVPQPVEAIEAALARSLGLGIGRRGRRRVRLAHRLHHHVPLEPLV